jgi:hypothetical protein
LNEVKAVFLSIFTAAIVALPAFAADHAITCVQWGRNSKDLDAMPSGPKPLRNLNRDANGVADDHTLVGDYRDPVLTPYAAAICEGKRRGSARGGIYHAQRTLPPISAAVQRGPLKQKGINSDVRSISGASGGVAQNRMRKRISGET